MNIEELEQLLKPKQEYLLNLQCGDTFKFKDNENYEYEVLDQTYYNRPSFLSGNEVLIIETRTKIRLGAYMNREVIKVEK